MHVAFYVTHLLGTGHLSRVLTLARAFSAGGHRATVVSGGMPVPTLDAGDVTILQLPPVRSDGVNFTRLLTGDGVPADEAYLADRRDLMVATLDDLAPDAIITELYPFGRRVLKGEFLALLNTCRRNGRHPKVFASVRDILAPPSRQSKAAETESVIAGYYDGVLVHSDAAVTPLSVSWPVSPVLQEKLRYTGFVAPPPPLADPTLPGAGEILVSAGGGAVGDALFQTAIEAAGAVDRPMRLLVGGGQARVAEIAARAGSAATVEPTRPEFRQMLAHAAVSVSMCGYNTALDLMQTGIPAILVPFDDGGEVEQSLRATSLARSPQFTMLNAASLTSERLAQAIAKAQIKPREIPDTSRFDGATQTVKIVEETLQ